MKIKKLTLLPLIFLAITLPQKFSAYSILRKKTEMMPRISVSWADGSDKNCVSDSHFEAHPIFTFSAKKNLNSLLPLSITHRELETKKISENLAFFIEDAVSAIENKKKLENFIVLQDKNFNYKKKAGLIVLKFKDHPFVVKLFFENPTTFLDRYAKGLESYVFTYMGSGTNRHVLGLSRIPNCDAVKQKIQQHSYWKDKIIFPRKWFWVHPKKQWLSLEGENIGGYEKLYNTIPSVYAVIADSFDTEQKTVLPASVQRKLIIDLTNYLELAIDPHRPNFIVADDPVHGFTISVIDTEHHPSCVGFKDPLTFSGYVSWYIYMVRKFLKDTYGRNKRERRLAQYTPTSHWAAPYSTIACSTSRTCA